MLYRCCLPGDEILVAKGGLRRVSTRPVAVATTTIAWERFSHIFFFFSFFPPIFRTRAGRRLQSAARRLRLPHCNRFGLSQGGTAPPQPYWSHSLSLSPSLPLTFARSLWRHGGGSGRVLLSGAVRPVAAAAVLGRASGPPFRVKFLCIDDRRRWTVANFEAGRCFFTSLSSDHPPTSPSRYPSSLTIVSPTYATACEMIFRNKFYNCPPPLTKVCYIRTPCVYSLFAIRTNSSGFFFFDIYTEQNLMRYLFYLIREFTHSHIDSWHSCSSILLFHWTSGAIDYESFVNNSGPISAHEWRIDYTLFTNFNE